MLPPARKLGTHLIPAHNGKALQDPRDDPKQVRGGWTMPTAPLPARESACAQLLPRPQAGTIACRLLAPRQKGITCVWDHRARC